MTPEEQARFEALERRVAELERKLQPRVWKLPERRPVAPAGTVQRRELNFGLNWISRIAVLTVALALAFFFQYAFENRLISETGRVALGLACAAAAFGAGEWFHHKAQRTYGQALAAAGAAFSFLSIWAAFGLYHLIPQTASLLLMVLTTGLSGLQAFRYGSQAVALLGLIGGYATPLLLGGVDQPWFVLTYALLLTTGAVAASRYRDWRWPEALALAGASALYVSQLPARPFYTAFVLAEYAAFFASRSIPVFLAAEALTPIALASIWAPGETGLILALATAAAGLALRPVAAPGAFAGFWIAYAIWYGQSGYTPLLILTAAYALFASCPFWRPTRLRAVDLVMLALNAGVYFGAAYPLLQSSYAPYAGLFAVGVAVAEAAAARLLWKSDRRSAVLSAGTAWVLLVLAAPIQFAGYRVTVTWAAEAAAMVWVGARLGERRAVRTGIALLVVTVARLALSDSRLPVENALLNPRLLAFAVSAAAFWASASFITEARIPAALYATGHAVLLWGLSLDALTWAARAALPENYASVASTALSVVAAAYAVLLVAGGAAKRHSGSRLLGIGLIGLVILKLYLYDVWLLRPFYRMAAFAILGLMLLVMSYLYSRKQKSEVRSQESE